MNKETMEKIDWENCNRWGNRYGGRGRLGQYYGSRYGEIIKVHEDGQLDILIKGYPEDEVITTDKFDVNYWEEDRRESKIRRMKERAEVGMWVEVVEFRIVFYIYIWEKKYYYNPDKCIIKHKFKCGEPHYSAREVEHRIFDVATKDYMDFKRFGRF